MIGLVFPRPIRGALRPFRRVYPEVRATRAIFAGPDAVAPIVAVGEASTGPTDDARLDPLHRFDQRLSDAADVRDLRVFADPDAVVDHAAQVFGEMAVDFRSDSADRLIQ